MIVSAVFLLFLTTASYTLYVQVGANKWLLETAELQFEEPLVSHNRKPRKWFFNSLHLDSDGIKERIHVDWIMGVTLCVCLCMCENAQMHQCICEEARGQCQVSSWLPSTLSFDVGSPHWIWNLLNQLDWLVTKVQASFYLSKLSLSLWVYTTTSRYYTSPGNLNSAYTANPLLTEPFP